MKSKLTTVTLTGADDTVDPESLIYISKKYPFVEWGILIGSQSGHRFPGTDWINRLLMAARPDTKLSLHICGKHLKRIAQGTPLDFNPQIYRFQRCQLNWHAEPQGEISGNIEKAFKAMPQWEPHVIFQLDGVNNDLVIHCSMGMKRISGLFDLSHGAGVLPEEWPKSTPSPFYLGYAGGLGPDNLREELPKIAEAAYGDYWIDMETKLYNGLQFDLVKCRDVLEIVKEFNSVPA